MRSNSGAVQSIPWRKKMVKETFRIEENLPVLFYVLGICVLNHGFISSKSNSNSKYLVSFIIRTAIKTYNISKETIF